MEDLKALALDYFQTFSNKDLSGVTSMFTGEISLKDWEIDAVGIEEVKQANKKIFDSVESIKVTPLKIYSGGSTVIAELTINVKGETQGQKFDENLAVLDVLTFQGNKISSIRAYKG